MIDSETSNQMQVERLLRVAPRRTPQAAWTMASRFVTDVLEDYTFSKTSEVSELLARMAPQMTALILLQALQAIRLSCPSFALHLGFESGSDEWDDRLERPVMFESAPDDCKPVLTILIAERHRLLNVVSLPCDGTPITLEVQYVEHLAAPTGSSDEVV